MKTKIFGTLTILMLLFVGSTVCRAQNNVLDEVAWVVGGEPILKSDIEFQRLSADYNGIKIEGDPYVVIPEQMAVQKLFLYQAELDSIEVTASLVSKKVDAHIDWMIQTAGSQEALEEYRNMSIREIRAELTKQYIESSKVESVKEKIIGDRTATPAEVRRYFKDLPQDSLPTVPTQVEIQIITQKPLVTQEEIDRIKTSLMEYAERVNNGESFAMLARLYSDDGSSARGGELGYSARAEFVPEFSQVAFALTDPKTVSKIVKTEYGYHIIQLIDRKGDKINCRHILKTPVLSDQEIDRTLNRLDSVQTAIEKGDLSFEQAVLLFSEDKETRYSQGLLGMEDNSGYTTSRIDMENLHMQYQDIAKKIESMQEGEVSKAFMMRGRKGQKVAAIIKLKRRIPTHKADITDDFQLLTDIVNARERERIIDEWVNEKIKTTYISIKDNWLKTGYKYNWTKQ